MTKIVLSVILVVAELVPAEELVLFVEELVLFPVDELVDVGVDVVVTLTVLLIVDVRGI